MGNTTIIIGVIVVIALIIGVGTVLNYVGRTADVVAKEIDPAVIQAKYVWFQNQKGMIDKADANIASMVASVKALKPSDNRSNWDRIDKEQYSQGIKDIQGNINIRNNLVKDYNVAMSEWHMRIANLGSWPAGAQYSQSDFGSFPQSIPEYSYGDVFGGI